MKPSKILVLRTCNADMSTYNGFIWPSAGAVVAPDWNPDPAIDCGQGLHGLAWGAGDWSLLSKNSDAKWLVVEVDSEDLVPSSDGTKARFRAGMVVYCGTEIEAITRVMCCAENFERIKSLAKGKGISSGNYSTAASSGNHSTAASSGDYSKAASSGDYSKAASSGYSSAAASSGNYSTAASSGNSSKAASSGDSSAAASSGNSSTTASSGYSSAAASSGYSSAAASSGDYSKAASSGDYSKAASSGNYSTAASSGNYSKAASSGNYSTTASSGNSGIAASIGNEGTVRAGPNGLLIACWWDGDAKRYHAATGEVGVDGIKADTDYRVVDGKLAEVAP